MRAKKLRFLGEADEGIYLARIQSAQVLAPREVEGSQQTQRTNCSRTHSSANKFAGRTM